MISITVYGEAKPKGSTRAFVVNGKAITTTDNPNTKEWQRLVADAAQFFRPEKLYDGAVAVHLEFYFYRPKSVSAKKRPNPTVKPDLDKLVRSILDALKGVIYTEDARVCSVVASKHYADPPRVEIEVGEIEQCT